MNRWFQRFAAKERINTAALIEPVERANGSKYWEMATEKPAHRSEIAGAVHEMVSGFASVGVVSKTTLRQFDEACLIQADPLAPEEIRELREREAVSQPVFAAYLNVSRNLVSDRERGKKRPGGPALRLLSIVRRRGLAGIA